jgi:hypothetical protein
MKKLVERTEEITVDDLVGKINNTTFSNQCCIAIKDNNALKLCWLDGSWYWINLNCCATALNFSKPRIKIPGQVKIQILELLKSGHDIYYFDSYQEYLERAQSLYHGGL